MRRTHQFIAIHQHSTLCYVIWLYVCAVDMDSVISFILCYLVIYDVCAVDMDSVIRFIKAS